MPNTGGRYVTSTSPYIINPRTMALFHMVCIRLLALDTEVFLPRSEKPFPQYIALPWPRLLDTCDVWYSLPWGQKNIVSCDPDILVSALLQILTCQKH